MNGELKAAADAFMATIEARVSDIVDKRLRAKTSVIPGGPYSSFSVNAQGLVTWAGAGLLAWYTIDGSGVDIAHTFTRLEYNTMVYDPQGLVTTGASWVFTAPNAGPYAFYATMNIATNATWSPGADSYAQVRSLINAGSAEQQVAKIYPRDGDAFVKVYLNGLVIYQLDATDTVYFEGVQWSNTSTLSTDDNSYVYVFRL